MFTMIVGHPERRPCGLRRHSPGCLADGVIRDWAEVQVNMGPGTLVLEAGMPQRSEGVRLLMSPFLPDSIIPCLRRVFTHNPSASRTA